MSQKLFPHYIMSERLCGNFIFQLVSGQSRYTRPGQAFGSRHLIMKLFSSPAEGMQAVKEALQHMDMDARSPASRVGA
ncbi:hypothetical protein CBR_g41283 [Chara braunii]|uniref:Uncharacterized protein n=1 Tax=Chara braunii TaxID=69332 RepID=A0A388LVL2_CHABU|nr:hypothetical protein CBR_g41283 [Chara braunii]|eukprot:GBG86289.1 hypothetical protein CBR_g41283 [Chara braunii]